ncbi:hypothetical protein HJFPF1_09641 [Paramyrothecium foliicola]|nr:hypothetical protein HJFPF1_09641 [Paramyrothecium foliicola]
MLLTSLESWAEDTKSLVAYVVASHPNARPPVLAGHSLGGGAVQHMLALGLLRPFEISGAVLLASSPLSGGGGDIGTNWERVEAPEGYEHPWSRRCLLETADQVRASFFTDQTRENIIQTWMDKSKTAKESARVGMRISRAIGAPEEVLHNLVGLVNAGRRRKILFVAGELDPLIPPEMVWQNAKAYEDLIDNNTDGDATCEKVIDIESDPALVRDHSAWNTLKANSFVNNPDLSELDRVYLRGIQGTWAVKFEPLADRVYSSELFGTYQGAMMVDHGPEREPSEPSAEEEDDGAEHDQGNPIYYDFTWRGTSSDIPNTILNNSLLTKGKIEFGHPYISGYFGGLDQDHPRYHFDGNPLWGPRRVARTLQSLVDDWNRLRVFGGEETIRQAPSS